MKIIDNFLPTEDFITIKNYIEDRKFPWYFTNTRVYEGDGNSRYVHQVYDIIDGVVTPLGESWHMYTTVLDKLNALGITKCKINSDIKSSKHHIREEDWHTDIAWCDSQHAYTCIYYINTNNGYTEFKTGEKVQSIENRLVLFRANLLHRGINQTDTTRRILINYNILYDGNTNS